MGEYSVAFILSVGIALHNLNVHVQMENSIKVACGGIALHLNVHVQMENAIKVGWSSA